MCENELSSQDIKIICDEVGCDLDQVLGILLEMNIISIKQENQTLSVHYKGIDKCVSNLPPQSLIFLPMDL